MTSLCITIKSNVVVDALSRKSRGVLAGIATREWRMLEAIGQFDLYYSYQVIRATVGVSESTKFIS